MFIHIPYFVPDPCIRLSCVGWIHSRRVGDTCRRQYRASLCWRRERSGGRLTRSLACRNRQFQSGWVPVVSCTTRASRAEPYLALAIELDVAVLLDLAGQVQGREGGGAAAETQQAVAFGGHAGPA